MPTLNTIVVVHTTATGTKADTDGQFELRIYDESEKVVFVQNFHDSPQNEREKGQTDAYHFDVSGYEIDSERISRIDMRKTSVLDDNWIPSSIFVVGLADDWSYVLGAHPRWRKTFDRENRTHKISGVRS
jgi:hypothetical protein